MTPYYDEDGITIYLADCVDVLPSLSGVDLVVTSPPYNLGSSPWPHLGHWKHGGSVGGGGKWRQGSDASVGVTYSNHDDAMPWDEYIIWQRRVLTLCWGALSDVGAIFYNHKPRVIGNHLWTPLELNPNLPLRQIVVWARSGGVNYSTTAYVPTHEWVLIFAKVRWRLSSQSASGLGDLWHIAQRPDPDHPAPFPLALPANAIETTAPSLVLDPFMGSGTTLLAAKAAGIPAIGIEVSERYCEIAAKRLAQGVLQFADQVREPG